MNQLQVIVHRQARVLTTGQLAESYGTNSDRISKNFSENKARYKEGKHFFKLEGEDLLHFRNSEPQLQVSKMARTLYLWTEKGAWLHAKSLNTDAAWDAYEMLVDEYYKIQEQKQQQPKSQLEIMQMQIEQMIKQEQEIKELKQTTLRLEQQHDNIVSILSLSNTDWRNKVNQIMNAIAMKLGGLQYFKDIRTESYRMLEERAGCLLDRRLENRQSKMALRGQSKTAISKINKLDVIAEDKKLISVYITVIKEMAVKYQLDIQKYDLKTPVISEEAN